MRHRKKSKKLGRMPAHLKATKKNMARAVILRESIKTTKTKAKVAQSFVEKLITIAKTNTPESKRHAFALLRDKSLIELLFNEVAPRFKSRNGGYTRVIPMYPRRGDGSPMAILELVEKKPKVEPKKTKSGKKEVSETPKKQEKPKKAELTPKKDEKAKETKKTKSEAKEETAPAKTEERKIEPHKVDPDPKAGVREEIRREKAKREDKKAQKGNIFRNIRKYFRHKSP
ncbi:MAG: 50S ribosomal protein L17 [Candidatus Omnitrophota bacterium]